MTAEQKQRANFMHKRWRENNRARWLELKRRAWQRRRARHVAGTAAWRKRNLEKVKASNLKSYWLHREDRIQRAKIYFHRNKAKCEGRKSQEVASLKDSYIRGLLVQCGESATPETIKQKRQEIQLWRTKRQFKLLAAGAVLSQALTASSTH